VKNSAFVNLIYFPELAKEQIFFEESQVSSNFHLSIKENLL